jgi:poly-beta-1,6-N-acetyl-D-glucosamine synthase
VIATLFWLCLGSILYTYAGYPLLLTLLARFRPRSQRWTGATPSVTLLITAYNEEAVIAQKLENCLALDYPPDRLQILVAVDGGADRTRDIVRQYKERGVELNFSPDRNGKMAAINRIMPQARGEIVVFSDANNLYMPETLRELVKPFADPTVGAVSGAKLILHGDGALGESEGLYWKYESFIKQQESRLGSCTGVVGEILALRRVLFEPPPEYIINDDFYMAMRLIKRSYRVVYAPQARSYERISVSAQAEQIRRTRIVAGRYQAMLHAGELLPFHRPLVVWQVVSHKFLRPLVPLAMIGTLLTNLVAVIWPGRHRSWSRLAPPIGVILLLSQLAFYGLAWFGRQFEQTGALGKLFYLPTFLVNTNLAALTGLYRFLSGEQTHRWQRAQRREVPAGIEAERIWSAATAGSHTPDF